jgi:hypothetical protein
MNKATEACAVVALRTALENPSVREIHFMGECWVEEQDELLFKAGQIRLKLFVDKFPDNLDLEMLKDAGMKFYDSWGSGDFDFHEKTRLAPSDEEESSDEEEEAAIGRNRPTPSNIEEEAGERAIGRNRPTPSNIEEEAAIDRNLPTPAAIGRKRPASSNIEEDAGERAIGRKRPASSNIEEDAGERAIGRNRPAPSNIEEDAGEHAIDGKRPAPSNIEEDAGERAIGGKRPAPPNVVEVDEDAMDDVVNINISVGKRLFADDIVVY